jgi:thymidylate kinase
VSKWRSNQLSYGPGAVQSVTSVRLYRSWRWAHNLVHSFEQISFSSSIATVAQTAAFSYATDFIDRLENEIVPALRAGFIVLTDRYIYSLMARAIVRGMDPTWIRSIYSVALVPDAVFYLRIGIDQLLPRVVFSRGFDYWESGMDLYPGHDMYDSFCKYQGALLSEFDQLGEEYKFATVDASTDADAVCVHLKKRILGILEPTPKETIVSNSCADLIETFTQRVLESLIPQPIRAEVHAGNGMEIASHQHNSAALRRTGWVAR